MNNKLLKPDKISHMSSPERQSPGILDDFAIRKTLNVNEIVMASNRANEPGELIRLRFNNTIEPTAKATIAFQDENKVSKAWLTAHDYGTYPTDQHKHFAIEVSDDLGALQSRLTIPYDNDIAEMTINQANLTIHRNAGETNGNLTFGGMGGGGNIMHATDLNIYPQNQSTIGFKIDMSGANLKLSGVGTSEIQFLDSISSTGTVSGAGIISSGTISGAALSVTGNISGAFYYGDGSLLQNPNLTSLSGAFFTLSGANTTYHTSLSGAYYTHAADSSDPHGATLTQTAANITNLSGTSILRLGDVTLSGAAYVPNIIFGTASAAHTASDYTQGTLMVIYT